ncbi:peptide ABC transporter substrate-binding protein [Roseovarius sp. TE539]|uniref:peptide ABC transporter substrate-binding protein n=1 Tax=Roseovarius sp. TE539 TaxID=2249812 RepID=UPI000DE003CD|nr:peptide ABC transporter substrate-binding protein [Roseovarius sp. TE539]RBI75239.1 peptide ABC transporter substrate-binding protein [Roseovarius sp. TE539]
MPARACPQSLCAVLLFLALAGGVPLTAQAGRGEDGILRILYWQAPSILNPYLSGGTKDIEAASLVLEPLARFDETGRIVPWLAETVPTQENGGINADRTRITWRLRDGLKWSDGSPVTAEDIRFTWRYCTAEGGGCAQAEKFAGVADVSVVDPRTVTVIFDAPRPYPYGPFVGAAAPILQKAQFTGCLGPRAPGCTEANFAPVGTGPFTVAEFRPNDVVRYLANPHYREPAKPAFGEAVLKGGGGAAAAARAVLETGEFDYAWNLQLAPDVLGAMAASGRGRLVSAFGTMVERIVINFTDPDPALGDARSTRAHPHPVLSDRRVRRALSMAIDRAILTEIGYGRAGRVTCNLVPAPEIYASDSNRACREQDLAGAAALLEKAGWTDSDGDGTRERNGRELRLTFQTSTNAVRQDFQAVIKQWWRTIGVETDLRNIDASVFFGSDPGSPDTFQKFFADVQMFAGTFDGTDPQAYLANWTCDEAPQPGNQWQGSNIGRWCDPEYDALVAEMAGTARIEERAALARRLNDMIVQDHAVLPLVDRGRVSAVAADLGGVRLNTWDSELWNIADWHRTGE